MSFGSSDSGGQLAANSDISFNSSSDGQVLRYSSSTAKWQNQTLAASDVSALPLSIKSQLTATVQYNTTSSSYPSRPAGFASVQWIGPTQPAAWVDGDTWLSTS